MHKIGQGTLGIILEPIFKSFKKSQKPDFIKTPYFYRIFSICAIYKNLLLATGIIYPSLVMIFHPSLEFLSYLALYMAPE